MNKTIKAAYITGILGIISTVLGAIIGVNIGKSSEQKYINNKIDVLGDDNNVTINDIDDIIEEYQNLKQLNNSLIKQNSTYFNELTDKNDKVSKLKSEVANFPDMQFKNIKLSIDTKDIPIKENKSMIIIDGREYLSKEIVEKLIPNNKNAIIKDDTLYIGKTIYNKANLFDQWICDQKYSCYMIESKKDSYGNLYSNCLLLMASDITFNTQGKYSFLKCDIAMSDELYSDSEGVLTISADGTQVYSVELKKLTKPFSELSIPINNCELLNISYTTNTAVSNNGCIIANAVIYNEK